MPEQEWQEYFFEWSWPEDSRDVEDLAREVLGVSRTAGLREIKSTYRALARQFHPDTNPSDKSLAERFRIISEAYEILTTDRNKRTRRLSTQRSRAKVNSEDRPYSEWWLERFRDLF